MNPLMLASAKTADFSDDTWWIWLIKVVFIIVFLIASVIMALWVERRGLARMQNRLGPNVVGPLGLGQAFADAAKLLLKEDFWLKGADKFIYFFSPVLAAMCAFSVMAVIPMGPSVHLFGHVTPLQLTDSPVSMLLVLAIAALGEYGLVLGGWSARSTLPLYGSVRSATQMISYELALGLSLVTVFLTSGTMSTSGIVSSQEHVWHIITLFPAFCVYLVAMFGETNRLPFDLPEAEGELVAGHTTEYSSMKFAWFYLSEYINMFNVSMVATTVFLGGWRAPAPLSMINDGMFNTGWWPMLWFIIKVWIFMFVMIWVRGTLLRFRYDQFMKLGWKGLIPIALTWLVCVMVIQGIGAFTTIKTSTVLFVIAAVFAVIVLLILIFGPKEPAAEIELDDDGFKRRSEEFDAFEGGFPVPPLPGQSLPPSPRAVKVTADTVSHAEGADRV